MTDINVVYFFVFGVLYLIGYNSKVYELIIGAGILLLSVGGSLTLFSDSLWNYIFSILIGVASIYHGIILIMEARKNATRAQQSI